MKLLSFRNSRGKRSYGIRTERGIVDLGSRLGERYASLRALLAAPGGITLAREYEQAAPDYQESEVAFLPVIEHPNKIFCVGMNYAAKRQEFAETNPAPTLFIRFPDSQTGHRCPVVKPLQSREFDYEGELAVVIGTGGRGIRREDALRHVAGYACYMDGSVRDWQHSWFTAGKNWHDTGAFGPWLVTPDEIGDPQQLRLRTFLNGMQVQDDTTASMIHPVAELVEYISTFSALSPGDVIITGSPGGVGKKRVPPLFMQAGDTVEVEISGIGRLCNVIADEVVEPLDSVAALQAVEAAAA
ncbi:5-oxopent-3-ene-1,2,5-tricarboxylate decarboxylase [Rubrivivax gelatinosus]|uniref:5-oxopent-3-ene-1,2,5-tricarboxylate decarboxylase n=1 Tax=Rubrivivax gelatinosus TaxID=28068 RepID=A0ABS1DTS2_RUBGE|nr:fumarylacetoacetate hydrolase family protein [Rubrivivax gelatinosus]MBK1613103.1 5-oxopent-3-ene-1,2,5-tricarboxylate decarboxylase [Rubrivivax gelatinosus]MBK1712595.1 5-oxopent-3-ene-1,2,5-tricarboxylate decarboxylase [Rubrivivax gelatinosus]